MSKKSKPIRRRDSRAASVPLQKRIAYFWILIAIFTASGFCGLVYQVVWNRLLVLVFGSTTYATSTVLAVFFFGLALGSYICGKYLGRIGNLVRFYAFLEMGIGIYAVLFFSLLSVVQSLHSAIFPYVFENPLVLNVIRVCLSFALLLPPTVMMGATVPVIGRALTRSPRFIGSDFGVVYAWNTFGAAFGCFMSAFLLIPAFGLWVSTLIGAFLNLAAGLAALGLSRRKEAIVAEESKASKLPAADASVRSDVKPLQANLVIIGFAFSGLLALIYEVAWSRALILVFGTSVYAFATMLTTYLVGLALGSMIMGRFIDRIRNPFLFFCYCQISIGASIFASTPLIGRLPQFFVDTLNSDSTWQSITAIEFFMCFLVMFVPSFASGTLFPLVSRIFMHKRQFRIGRTIADVYSFNTFGAIFGALAAGFLLIPAIGIEKTLLLGGACSLLIASIMIPFSAARNLRTRYAFGGILLICSLGGFLLLPSWNKAVMSAGVFVYGNVMAEKSPDVSRAMSLHSELYYREGPAATVAVFDIDNTRFLRINGKTDGGDSRDNFTQKLLGFLPLVYADRPERALVIGLGTGITLGSVLHYPDLRADCVEISPAVVEASHFFDHVSGNPLASGRAEVHVLDGRTWLKAMPKSYDMIVSEPSHPWQTGNANLFTYDFFELAVKRLKPGGVFCQWLPYYRMEKEHFQILVKSFNDVFHYVNVWMIYSDVILIGSDQPLVIDQGHLEQLLGLPPVKESLSELKIVSLADLLSFFYLDAPAVGRFVQGVTSLNTDNDPIIEYSAPKYLFEIPRENVFLDLLRLSYGASVPLRAEAADLEALKKERVLGRVPYFRQWGIPPQVTESMLRAYGIQ